MSQFGTRQLEPGIRNAVRAVIYNDQGQLLVLQKAPGSSGAPFALPGGAQQPGETLSEALQRECLEEIGTTVEIGPLLYLADYCKPRSNLPERFRQQLELLFSCRVAPNYRPHCGAHPDKRQTGVLWIDPQRLDKRALAPGRWGELLRTTAAKSTLPGYLGVVE